MPRPEEAHFEQVIASVLTELQRLERIYLTGALITGRDAIRELEELLGKLKGG